MVQVSDDQGGPWWHIALAVLALIVAGLACAGIYINLPQP